MRTFIWVAFYLCAFESLGRILWATRGYMPPRTMAGNALDFIFCLGLMTWAAVLLFGN